MGSDKKTFIFFPLEAGLAHITRSLAIAEELVKRQHRVIFALTKNKQYLVTNKNIKILGLKEFFNDEQSIEKIKDPSYIYPFILEEIEILKKYKPDLAVVDFRLSAIVSCRIVNIPVVFITNSDGLPFQTYLPNLGLPKFLQVLLTPLFHLIIANFKSQYFKSLTKAARLVSKKFQMNDLFNLTYIIPEPKDYLPVQNNKFDIHYVGPIWWEGFNNFKPSWLKDIKPDKRTIYLTFGGTGYDPQKLLILSELLVKKGYRVIVSSSNIAKPQQFKQLENLYVERFLPGFEVCQRVDLVVCHGGIGTMVQALLSKKVVVAVPFNPDQTLHAFRFEELGLGKCVPNLKFIDLFRLDWENYEQKGRDLPIERILNTIGKVLNEKDQFKDNIEKYSKKFSTGDGRKSAADIIEKIAV